MTDDKVALPFLLEKSSEATVLHEMIDFAPVRLLQLEAEALWGAAPGEREC